MERFNLRLSTISKNHGEVRLLTIAELVSKASLAIEERYPELKKAIYVLLGSTTLKSEPIANVELDFVEHLPDEHAIKLRYIIREPKLDINI